MASSALADEAHNNRSCRSGENRGPDWEKGEGMQSVNGVEHTHSGAGAPPPVAENTADAVQLPDGLKAKLKEPLPRQAVSPNPQKPGLSVIKVIYVVERLKPGILLRAPALGVDPGRSGCASSAPRRRWITPSRWPPSSTGCSGCRRRAASSRPSTPASAAPRGSSTRSTGSPPARRAGARRWWCAATSRATRWAPRASPPRAPARWR